MAVTWGAWEYSGGNGMRVGVEVSSGDPGHSWPYITITVDYWTENQFTYGDTQTLNLTGAIGGSIANFTNNQGGVQTKRGTRTYTYDYGANEYGSSPVDRNFGCTLTGAYNGVTPSVNKLFAVPGRPYGAPAPPTGVSASRVNDKSAQISWARHSTIGEPYQSQLVQCLISGGSWQTVASLGGAANSYTDSIDPNNQYSYRVRSENSAGYSSLVSAPDDVWTTPGTPGSISRTASGADQVVGWANHVGYAAYRTEIWRQQDGVWDSTPLATRGPGVTTYTDVAPSSAHKYCYRVRAYTTGPDTTLYSGYSGTSSESSGVTSAPNPPTGLIPDGATYDPTQPIQLLWVHNPTDGTGQTQYQIQHRVVGSGTWTTLTKVTSGASNYTMPAGTYTNGQQIEWQVRTWGAGTTSSAYSASAIINMASSTPVRYPVYLNSVSGRLEASTAGGGGGGAVVLGYVHNQGSSASIWTINHPLTFQPNVAVVDSGGSEVEGDVKHVTGSQITVTFSAAFAGTAYLS